MDDSIASKAAAARDDTQMRRAARSLDDAWAGGVCAGLANHLGWSVMVLRVIFVLAGALQFVGVAAYLLLWLGLPPAQERRPVGLESATRAGTRSSADQYGALPRGSELGTMIAFVSLWVGLSLLLSLAGVGLSMAWIATGMVATCGVFCLWNCADKITAPLAGSKSKRSWVPLTKDGWLAGLQLTVGSFLLVGAGLLVMITSDLSGSAWTVLLVVVVVAGVAIAGAPLVSRSRFALAAARDDKLVADAQADMAAHLHDSVLQTLALIQRQAHDPQAVARMARRQERDLREWLYGDQMVDSSFAAALKRVAAEIEDDHDVVVQTVVVGDVELSESVDAVVNAAREAILNAAKHSTRRVADVYAEVTDGSLLEVFVRDRGVGFDVESIPTDRHGVRQSILDRMSRHGGRAQIRSTPGEGTEVRLEMRIA